MSNADRQHEIGQRSLSDTLSIRILIADVQSIPHPPTGMPAVDNLQCKHELVSGPALGWLHFAINYLHEIISRGDRIEIAVIFRDRCRIKFLIKSSHVRQPCLLPQKRAL